MKGEGTETAADSAPGQCMWIWYRRGLSGALVVHVPHLRFISGSSSQSATMEHFYSPEDGNWVYDRVLPPEVDMKADRWKNKSQWGTRGDECARSRSYIARKDHVSAFSVEQMVPLCVIQSFGAAYSIIETRLIGLEPHKGVVCLFTYEKGCLKSMFGSIRSFQGHVALIDGQSKFLGCIHLF